MERRSAAELDRIWSWAVARGYTWETDTYVSPECLRAEWERTTGTMRIAAVYLVSEGGMGSPA